MIPKNIDLAIGAAFTSGTNSLVVGRRNLQLIELLDMLMKIGVNKIDEMIDEADFYHQVPVATFHPVVALHLRMAQRTAQHHQQPADPHNRKERVSEARGKGSSLLMAALLRYSLLHQATRRGVHSRQKNSEQNPQKLVHSRLHGSLQADRQGHPKLGQSHHQRSGRQ